jgi:low affinity Fe/Cu permease
VELDQQVKQTVMKNQRKFKEEGSQITISHDLPKNIRARRRQLMEEARQEKGNRAENFLFKFVGPLGRERVKVTQKQQIP